MGTRGQKARLVLLTCVWRRPALTRMVLGAYQRIRGLISADVDLRLMAVGSEGQGAEELCVTHGFDYIEHPNTPLSLKWNAGVRASREYDADGLAIVGSDDLISAATFLVFAQKLQEGIDFFGFSDLFFFHAPSQRLGYWAGYGDLDPHRIGEPIGCGRCFSRALLERTGWRLWPETPGYNSGLDDVTLQFVEPLGFTPESWTMAELGGRAVDIKVGPNITPFQQYRYRRSWSGSSVLDFFSEWFSDEEVQELLDLAQVEAPP